MLSLFTPGTELPSAPMPICVLRSNGWLCVLLLALKPDEGGMKGLAFAYDPDGYWVEIVKRGGL
jgi:hypothetical protein